MKLKKEDMDQYPSLREHMFIFNKGPKMKKNTVIDYEI